MSGETTECYEHDWFFEPGDICPVCEGISIGKANVIKLLERDICPDWTLECCDGWCGAYNGAIHLINLEG